MIPYQSEERIGYLLKAYPKISETFILNEILALEEQGTALRIFALEQPTETVAHRLTSKVRAEVIYLSAPRWQALISVLKAHCTLFVQNPGRYFGALRFLLRRQEGGGYKDFLQAGLLAWVAKREGVTLLHVHFANRPASVAEITRLLTGLPYGITAHAKDIYLSPPTVLDRKMRCARYVITCTEYNRRYLQKLSTNTVPIYRVYHGLDGRRFHSGGARTPEDGLQPPTILSVGRFREKKGFSCLLQACQLLKSKGYHFRCQIVGYGPLQAHLEQLIAALGLGEAVVMLGRLTQDRLLELYRQATLFVLPCQIAENGDRDGIPNVLIEAMAMELPVVSTNVSGIPELVDHMQTGLLVPPRNPTALATTLAFLFDRPRVRHELGRAGRQKVCREFSSAHNTARVKALLTEALAQ
ncbi:MAG: glycosyltransferase [Candidatus Binatia bacterium]